MRSFFRYLRQFRGSLALAALFCCIFALTFWLYGLPVEAVLYPAALCAVVALAALVVDFRRAGETLRQLERIETAEELPPLPETSRLAEGEYQRIIRSLAQEQTNLRSEARRQYDDMVDYYTIWAHQIKTPMAAMELTLQNEDTPLSRRLRGELTRMEQYVEMVLVFLRLGSDSTDYVLRSCELDAVVRPCVRRFSGEFIGRRLQLHYEPLHTSVLTDEKWLGFVVEQLLSNALKYTPSGEITISMASPGVLCIRDTGMGIAPEDLPRIFEKGYTGCRGRADRKASGIGLYLCRRVCTNLGHRLWAESTPDVGTAIFLDLNQRPLEVE